MTDKPENTPNPDAPVAKSPFATPNFPATFDARLVKPPVTADLVIKLLLDLPDDILDYQKIFDTVSIMYETRLSDLTFKALSTMMFQGKDNALRIASNDKEREIATSQVLLADEKMKLLTVELNEASRELTLAKMKFEAAKIAAHLLSAK